ncbi:pilus assembly protein [Leptothrix sp. BB-4]
MPTRSSYARTLLLGLTLASTLTLAAVPDIANVPLGASSTTTAKPNIMFILDDSGSMDWEYMPDEIDSSDRYGYWSSQCNGVAFNPDPNVAYLPPVRINSTTGAVESYPNASFTAALDDGFNSGSGTTNLATSGRYYYNYIATGTAKQTPLSWTYSVDGTADSSTTFYQQCMQTIGSSSTLFQRVDVSTLSTSEKQRYANWYSYYRKRMLTMRTAAGRAFSELSDGYRVGFTKISDSGVNGSSFLPPADFTTAQKVSFFNLLYGASPGGFTPLRGALSKIGRYYGGAITRSGSPDPVQYSCQRNYAVLSTDGYWNTDLESSSYGPFDLTGNNVGQVDGTEQRPMKDSASNRITRVRTQEVGSQTASTTPMRLVATGRRNVVAATTGGNCNRDEYQVMRTGTGTASCTIDWTRTDTTISSTVTTYTTVIVDGVAGATTVAPSARNVTLSSTSPSCPQSSWVVSNTSESRRCRTASQLASDGLTPGATIYTVSSSNSTSTGASVTGSTTPINTDNTVETTTTTAGDSNTLADVAEYFWKTDLRANLENNVPTSSSDPATHQHMSTFTIGLGLKGTLNYDRNYLTQSSGDFVDIKNGLKDWPVPAGTLGNRENATHIDDLWHAAVNGRGQYFSASNPDQLDDAISTSLASIKRVTESGAAAAASTLTPVLGDDWVFVPSFTTVEWAGDLRAFKFTFTSTGELVAPDTSPGQEIWSASRALSARTSSRRVLFRSGTSLAAFTGANLAAAGLDAPFANRCTRTSSADNLSQCASLSANARAKVTTNNLVSYLTGDKTLYLNALAIDDQVFRTRTTSLLGDFVNASPVYVGKPPFRYADAGYAAFATEKASRIPVVYAAGNDGMLHAFKVGTGRGDTTGGTELWAYVPSAAMGEMWRLADQAYSHRYYVDATPNVSDIYDTSVTPARWRTILVGGLGGGGRGYYALDITDPENPVSLWEFTDTNLGYSYGNPVVTKDASGTWIVAFTSGTNNVNDGVGRLYVLNAATGALIRSISTATGTAGTPSNMGRLNAWVSSDTDNTALRFYAGDTLGNLWRFDHDDRIAPAGREAQLLGRAEAPDGTAQPIMAKPVLTEKSINGVPTAIISVGTGRLLTTTDLGDTTVQSIYSIKDTLGASSLGVLRSTPAGLVQQTLNSSRLVPTVAPVDWSTRNGWYIDLTAASKEKIYVDGVQLASGIIAFASTVPTADACSQGGASFLYQIDLGTGAVTGVDTFTTMIVGLNRVMSNNGKVSAIVTTQDQKTVLKGSTGGTGAGGNSVRRASWREITD